MVQKIKIIVKVILCLMLVITMSACLFISACDSLPNNNQNQTDTVDGGNETNDSNTESESNNNQNQTDTVDGGNETNDSNSESEQTETLGFADVGGKYNEVIKPIYDLACYILEDLVESGHIEMPDESYNPRVVYMRYSSPKSFYITYCYDVYTRDSGVKSEFLEREAGVNLLEFTGSNESYNLYRDFLIAERKYENSQNYIDKILPMAEEVAKILSVEYDEYKGVAQVDILNFGKKLILKADSSLSELHDKIIDKINETLPLILENPYHFDNGGESVYPLVDYGYDIEISFGGNLQENPPVSRITVIVNFQNFQYKFYSMPFNEDGEFTKEYIAYMLGAASLGYDWTDQKYSDWNNPTNEEYSEFFDKLKIEEMKFPLEFSGNPYNYFVTFCWENTWLCF